jgi:hypothetical protein
MLALNGAQIGREAALEVFVHFAEEVLQEDVFSRNGGIGFEFENPMPVGLLEAFEGLACVHDNVPEDVRKSIPGGNERTRMHHHFSSW